MKKCDRRLGVVASDFSFLSSGSRFATHPGDSATSEVKSRNANCRNVLEAGGFGKSKKSWIGLRY
jgi:hypothetical protein